MTWRRTTLGDICAEGGGRIQTGPFGSQLHAFDYVNSGIPSVMPQNIGDNVIDDSGIARITEADAERLSKYLLRPGDIVYSRRGDVEKRALVRQANDGWLCGTGCLRVSFGENSPHDPAFISYLLGTEDSRAWIVRHAVGATMPNLNTAILSGVPVSVPEPAEQRAIAEVLGALDDKIAANAKLAETSARLAASVFLEAVGNERVSSQLKLVARNVPGKYLPKDEYVEDGEYFVYGSNSVMGKYDRSLCAGHFTVLAKIGSYCGNLRWSQRPAWVNNNASGIVPLEGVNPWILRHALENLDMGPHRAGTGQPYIRMESLFSAEVDLPSPACSERISPSLESLAEAEAVAIEENRTLATTRDTLLPQLMSGKLRVRDIENTMGEMV